MRIVPGFRRVWKRYHGSSVFHDPLQFRSHSRSIIVANYDIYAMTIGFRAQPLPSTLFMFMPGPWAWWLAGSIASRSSSGGHAGSGGRGWVGPHCLQPAVSLTVSDGLSEVPVAAAA